MADTSVTQTTAAPFIPELWGNMALGKVAGTLMLGSIVNRNWANAPANVGDIVNVPVRGAITSALLTSGAAMEAQAPSDTSIQVTVDKHRYASFKVPADVSTFTNQDVMEGYLSDAAVVIAEDMEKDGFAVAYAGFTTNAVGAAGTAADAALLIQVREKMALAKIPQGAPKYGFLYPTVVTSLLGVAALTESDKVGVPTAIVEGAIGRKYGVTWVESQYIPITTGTPDDIHNVALAPDALTLAIRPLAQPRSSNVISRVAQGAADTPQANLGLRIWMAWDTTYGADKATVEALYGWKVIRETFGVHVHA